jgi:RecA-family ATPase
LLHVAYRFAAGFWPVADAALPEGFTLLRPGDEMSVARCEVNDALRAKSIADLPEMSSANEVIERAVPPIAKSGLSNYSLLGRAGEFEARVVEAKPLLGNVCQSGQATIWYAPPNAGKTLIGLSLLGDAVQAKRVQPGNVYYINADDSSAGFVAKMRLMDDLGVHTLAPGQRKFESATLVEQLQRSVREATASGVFIIIDTLKKFVDLMNKAQASAFADACRLFVMGGGTVLAFAHTNKNPLSSGRLTYAGTADIVQDFDAVYLLTPSETEGSDGQRLVRFDALKRRGSGAAKTAYSYASEDEISYEERLLSVREVDPEWLGDFERVEAEREDEEVIQAIKSVIDMGVTKKMELATSVAKRLQISGRRALRVLEAYTGSNPQQHHWTFATKARGAKVYEILKRTDASDLTPDTS